MMKAMGVVVLLILLSSFVSADEKTQTTIVVSFKQGVTENEANNMIQSLGLITYKLSDWETGEKTAIIEVLEDTEQTYMLQFEGNALVETAEVEMVKKSKERTEKMKKDLILVTAGATLIIVLFFIGGKRLRRELN